MSAAIPIRRYMERPCEGGSGVGWLTGRNGSDGVGDGRASHGIPSS